MALASKERPWHDAVTAIVAACEYRKLKRLSLGVAGRTDERQLRKLLHRALPNARAHFRSTHGKDDGQTCRCRIKCLVASLCEQITRDDALMQELFEHNWNAVKGFLEATAVTN